VLPLSPPDVRLLTGPFDPAEELAAFTAACPDAGGIVSFLGQVRAAEGGGQGVEALELRHYGPLTLPAMQDLGARVAGRWDLDGLLILHRSGTMLPGDPIVLVAAAARHRRDAFAAADFAMDHLKSESWFWKREKTGGTWRWIEPREQDFEDIARWQ
jgi:molybdopterin synthase catalytic subunit